MLATLLQNGFDALWHAIDQRFDDFLVDGLPLFFNQCSKFRQIGRLLLVHSIFDDRPQIFDRIQIGRVSRPRTQNLHFVVVKELFDHFCSVTRRAIMLVNNPFVGKLISDRWKKMIVQDFQGTRQNSLLCFWAKSSVLQFPKLKSNPRHEK